MNGQIKYELLLKNGTLIDPGQDINARMDVGFKDGVVVAVEDRIDPATSTTVVDVAGSIRSSTATTTPSLNPTSILAFIS